VELFTSVEHCGSKSSGEAAAVGRLLSVPINMYQVYSAKLYYIINKMTFEVSSLKEI